VEIKNWWRETKAHNTFHWMMSKIFGGSVDSHIDCHGDDHCGTEGMRQCVKTETETSKRSDDSSSV
jgi:hypothetical protein